MILVCGECGKRPVARPTEKGQRGICCWGCYHRLVIKPGQDRCRNRRKAIASFQPTDALPGTDAKKLVMQERMSLGLPLFHPHDARWSKELVSMLAGEECNVCGLSFIKLEPVVSQFEQLTSCGDE